MQRLVSELLRGRLKDVDFFQYSERRRKPDGSFNGVIAVSISPAYFHKQFAQASEMPDSIASIVRADGEILVRYPGGPGSRLDPDSSFMRAIARNPESGRYAIERSGFDGIARVFMYRKLPDLPVYVVHGLSTQAIHQAWNDRMAFL